MRQHHYATYEQFIAGLIELSKSFKNISCGFNAGMGYTIIINR